MTSPRNPRFNASLTQDDISEHATSLPRHHPFSPVAVCKRWGRVFRFDPGEGVSESSGSRIQIENPGRRSHINSSTTKPLRTLRSGKEIVDPAAAGHVTPEPQESYVSHVSHVRGGVEGQGLLGGRQGDDPIETQAPQSHSALSDLARKPWT